MSQKSSRLSRIAVKHVSLVDRPTNVHPWSKGPILATVRKVA